MTLARRSRSASAWRAIARCISCGRSTFFTSTVLTLIPHGSVWPSMTSWSSLLILSLLSTIGMRKMRPGPFIPMERPRRKITPRSYSRSTLMELVRRRIPMNRTVSIEYETIRDPLLGLLDPEREPVDTVHDDRGALGDRGVRLGGPVL